MDLQTSAVAGRWGCVGRKVIAGQRRLVGRAISVPAVGPGRPGGGAPPLVKADGVTSFGRYPDLPGKSKLAGVTGC